MSLAVALCACQPAAQDERAVDPLAHLTLPEGFAIETWARVPGARTLAVAAGGADVYVGTAGDSVFVVRDPDLDGLADRVDLINDDFDAPSGVAVGDDAALFVVERHRVLRIAPDGEVETVVPAGVLPEPGQQGGRSAGVGPDGRLYVTVDASCEGCVTDGFAGTILRLRPNGHDLGVFARGLRASTGLDWHPVTAELFFTDQGGDLGGERAPDELNRARRPDLHYGYPYVYGAGAPYPEFANQVPPTVVTPPELELDAGAGAAGIEFYEGSMFPETYRLDAFVAQHGAWSSSGPAGYRVIRVRFRGDRPAGSEAFIDGWVGADGRLTGRPVDIEELPDGSLLVSDDHAGAIYRVTYADPSP